MSTNIENINKAIAISSRDAIAAQIAAENKQHRDFMAEYERYRLNKRIYPNLQLTPDAYPLILELFNACKNHLPKFSSDDIERQHFQIPFHYFGRSWRIAFLHQGRLRHDEVHLAICHDEPNPSPFAVIGGFRLPKHWDFS